MEDINVLGRLHRIHKQKIDPGRRSDISTDFLLLAEQDVHIENIPELLSDVRFRCTIAGTTTSETFLDQLKRIVIDNGLESKIEFSGFLTRSELRAVFYRNNVLVFPAIADEAFGSLRLKQRQQVYRLYRQ